MQSRADLDLTKCLHVLVCAAILLLLSWGLLSTDPLAVVRRSPFSVFATISDLIMHCGAYFTLAALSFAAAARTSGSKKHRAVKILLICHALITECLQAWIPQRSCDPLDALANLTGIALGAAAVAWFFAPRSTRSTANA